MKYVAKIGGHSNKKLLGRTKSLCPVCFAVLAANRVAIGGEIYLEKQCPKHGYFQTEMAGNRDLFENWAINSQNDKPKMVESTSQMGCPYDCGICENHAQDACCVLLELTSKCNQNCPICYANAGANGVDLEFDEINEMLQYLKKKAGTRDYNIQLSGGEPSLHPDIFAIISRCCELGFPYIQLNTNGKKLANDENFSFNLKKSGLSSVFLQFDGMNDGIYQAIRGENLLETKLRAIENCAKVGLNVTLVVTVVEGINNQNLGEILDFTIDNMPAIRGIHLQPVSRFGRYSQDLLPQSYTLSDLAIDLEKYSNKRLLAGDFVPLATGHSQCSFHCSYIVDENSNISAISSGRVGTCSCGKNSIETARDFIEKKWGERKSQVLPAIGDGFDFSAVDNYINTMYSRGFAITAMDFQDVYNLDLERVKKCRVHILTPELKMIPFCVKNLTNEAGENFYDLHLKAKS